MAFVDVGGRRLDLLTAEEINDAALADLWHNVALLQRHRLIHRRRRARRQVARAPLPQNPLSKVMSDAQLNFTMNHTRIGQTHT